MNYQEINAETIDRWVKEGWEWGQPITHEAFLAAQKGQWDILLTPTRPIPHEWLGDVRGKKILGLASGGGQQMPIMAALGADVTVLDYSPVQLETDRLVAEREGYDVTAVRADMTKPLPFPDDFFDIIIHPVSNVYVEKVEPIFAECYRVLKKGGILVSGLDNGINFAYDGEETELCNTLPFNPLKNPEQMKLLMDEDCGVQFSHTAEEQLGGQLRAGFRLSDVFGDTNGAGNLHEHGVESFWATRAVKD